MKNQNKTIQWVSYQFHLLRSAPIWFKGLLLTAAILYLFCPVDMIPDLIFPVGFFDDIFFIISCMMNFIPAQNTKPQ